MLKVRKDLTLKTIATQDNLDMFHISQQPRCPQRHVPLLPHSPAPPQGSSVPAPPQGSWASLSRFASLQGGLVRAGPCPDGDRGAKPAG